jgi:hypothetical protein
MHKGATILLWQIPGNVIPLLRNDQGKHCYIRGNERNEYVQLLKPRQRLAKRGIYHCYAMYEHNRSFQSNEDVVAATMAE